MTHAELSRKRALHSIDGFLSALDEYARRERHPRDRYLFSRSDGVIAIRNDLDMPTGLLTDLESLRDALTGQSATDVEAILHRFVESDYVLPFDVNTNYRAHYAELFNLSREYVEISTLASEQVDDERRGDAATHGLDFRDVKWHETKYVFSPKQAACVRILWEAWERGNPWVADGTVLQKAGVGDRQRLRDVFKNHPAWGTMIVQGPQQDLHGLQEPSKKL